MDVFSPTRLSLFFFNSPLQAIQNFAFEQAGTKKVFEWEEHDSFYTMFGYITLIKDQLEKKDKITAPKD
jgi:hypothetical protein